MRTDHVVHWTDMGAGKNIQDTSSSKHSTDTEIQIPYSGLQNEEVYTIQWFTGYNVLHNTMVYTTQWFTKYRGLPNTVVYKIHLSTECRCILQNELVYWMQNPQRPLPFFLKKTILKQFS